MCFCLHRRLLKPFKSLTFRRETFFMFINDQYILPNFQQYLPYSQLTGKVTSFLFNGINAAIIITLLRIMNEAEIQFDTRKLKGFTFNIDLFVISVMQNIVLF